MVECGVAAIPEEHEFFELSVISITGFLGCHGEDIKDATWFFAFEDGMWKFGVRFQGTAGVTKKVNGFHQNFVFRCMEWAKTASGQAGSLTFETTIRGPAL